MAETPGMIARGLKISGELSGDGDLVVEGEIQGSIHMSSSVVIEESARVEANIAAGRLTIRGHASGHLDAKERIEVRAGASVRGEIRAPSVVIEEGAAFSGRIHMDVGLPADV